MQSRELKRIEVTPEVVFVGKLLERVTGGALRVPRFQRPFVWKQHQILQLLDSIVEGYPIGSILLWETDSTVTSIDQVGPIEVKERPKGVVSYLLDGQQRVSTLAGTLQLPEKSSKLTAGVNWRVYYDLEEREFLPEPRGGAEVHHFPVRSLLSTSGFLAACRHIETTAAPRSVETLLQAADRLANAFRDYQVPTITIKDANLDAAVTVFARLNLRGRRMTADQMVSALTYREGQFHLATKLDEFQAEISHRGFGCLDRGFILRSVLAAMGRDIYAKDWEGLMVRDEVREALPEAFEDATRGLRLALKFLEDLGVTSDRLLPYGLQLVLLAEFFRLRKAPSDSELESLLRRWFWVTSFTAWFGGVNTARVGKSLEEMRELARGERREFDVFDLESPAEPFPERFDARSARVRAFLLYLVSLHPQSIHGVPSPLRPGELLSELGPGALAYVSSSLPGPLRSSPANRMFADRDHSGQTWNDLTNQDESILVSHGFSDGARALIRDGNRERVIEARLQKLIDGERGFLEKQRVRLPASRQALAAADSDSSDTDEIE